MFGSMVLDVAIGLSLLFLFVSLICSAIREAFEIIINSRASDLERGIREMLNDPRGDGITRALYDHPMVFALFSGTYEPERLRPHRSLLTGGASLRMPIWARGNLPAYIPAENFASALLDLTLRGPVSEGTPIPEAARDGADTAAQGISIEVLALRVQAMGDPRLRRVLLTALDSAGGDPGKVRHAIERWFDGCMERVSGWYKRRTQGILFAVGLMVAGAMNVDAFSVGRALFQDKALRDGAVAQAATLVPREPDKATPDEAMAAFAALRSELAQIRFPCGWGDPPPQRLRVPRQDGKPGTLAVGAVAQMLAGWLVTAFAVTLGAPFWFDMLNRFMIARSTIKPRRRDLE